jgi:hypothetical protein
MNAKDFVQKYRPTAEIETQKRGQIIFKTYYLIREYRKTMYIASGDTKAQAWAKAAEVIAKELVKSKCPQAELLQPMSDITIVQIYDPVSFSILSKASTPVNAWIKAVEVIELQEDNKPLLVISTANERIERGRLQRIAEQSTT